MMIPKQGKDFYFQKNYRPISLLSFFKAVERIIKNRLEKYTENHDIISEHQFAFQKGLETELQIIMVMETIKEGLQRKDLTSVVLLDVEETFDRVWNDGFTYKVLQLGIPRKMIHILDSYLRDPMFQV